MTENKRFKQVGNGVKDTRTGRTLTLMLEFTLKLNEINDLYDCVFDRNEKLEKVNEQLKNENKQLKSEIRYFQSKLHNNTMEVRERTLAEVKESIRKLERWE